MRNAERLAILLLLAAASGVAQDPLRWTAKTGSAAPLAGGASFAAEVTGVIEKGWHIYSLTQGAGGPFPTRITLPQGQPFTLDGAPAGPSTVREMDANFGIETESHAGTVVFRVPVKVAGGAAPGEHPLQIHVRYQACDETQCLPPRTDKLTVPVQLAGGGTAALPGRAGEGTAAPRGRGSMSSFLWLAMSMGALSLLTPCVFPMVPITVSYFAKHAAQKRGAAVRDAGIYALGIILTFTALGVALAVLFGAAGLNRFAANPWVNLGITAIFLAFAMSLLGSFELAVPSVVLTRLDSAARGESSRVAGLLLMGLTFSLTSFTCTAPFVGTLLVMASQGEWLDPVAGMLAFSSVFALPFFALALAPQLVSQLPKAGGWLNSVKVVMGLLEIAAAMKFLSNVDLVWHWGVFTRTAVLAVWIAIGVLTVLYILGYYRTAHDSPVERVGALRLTAALAFLAVTVALVPGLFDRPLGELDSFLPPAQSELTGGAPVESGGVRWILNDYDGAREQARREQKLVFVDFTGYTCTNCRWMEVNMFPRPAVKSELEKFVRVRLYTDGEGALYDRQQQMQQRDFGTVALPLYAIVDPDGKAIATFPGLTRDTAEFVRFLQKRM